MHIPATPVEVFYSFAKEDASLLKKLDNHLSTLRHEKLISSWNTRQIMAGSNWQEELDAHLNTASLILLCVSSDFLASGYQYGRELQRAMQRHTENEARVIPIILRPCDWTHAPFAKLQIVPRNRKAVTSWSNQDEAFTEIAREIRTALESLPRPVPTTNQTTRTPQTEQSSEIWQVPYKRNLVFTGRHDVLDTLAQAFAVKHADTSAQPQAISGLGGIGKTQMAIEYAYRFAQRYHDVFWVSAATQESLISGYAGLAGPLNLREKDASDQNVLIQAVRNWLQNHTNWLLILDNVEDLSQIEPLLPPSPGGHILITTRSQLTGRFAQRTDINPLPNKEGALLLLRYAGRLSEQRPLQEVADQDIALAQQISEELGGLPLALSQAGAYIDETACSLSSYYQQYQKRRAALLQWRGRYAHVHPEAVATTWSLSFEKVESDNPIAAKLLRFCAFLAPDAIPEELLIQALKGLDLEAESWQIDEAMVVLRSYSLIQRNAQKKSVWIHRLVQAVLRDAMNEQEQLRWITLVVSAVNALFPEVEFHTWQQCAVYLPQAQICATWITQKNLLLPEGASLLHKAGMYLMDRAQYSEAQPLYELSLHISEQTVGPEHPDTASTLHELARLAQAQGNYAQAQPLYERALRIYEQSLGSEHPNTATTLNEMARLAQAQGNYAQAQPLYERALRIYEQSLGPGHPATKITQESYDSLLEILESDEEDR
jgi:tetratricopeptide (TPR) repeat protein